MTPKLESYVTRKLRGDAWIDFAGAVAAFFGGILMLVITWYVVLAVTWIALVIPWRVAHASQWARIVAAGVIVLAFVESWRDQRRLFEQFTQKNTTGGAALSAGLYLLGVGYGPRCLIPLSPATSRNLVRIFADALCSGPRLLTNSVRLVRRGRARATADFNLCARVLEMALKKPGRLPFKQVRKAHPDLSLLRVAEQLSWIDGVVLLRAEPPGLTLTDALREELIGIVSDSRQ